MPRVKRGVGHVKRRKKLLKLTKGYRWGRKNKPKLAKVAATKAGVFSYRDRKNKKRVNRSLWLLKINAAIRPLGITYSKFIDVLKKKNIEVDRKVLAVLAEKHPEMMEALVKKVK